MKLTKNEKKTLKMLLDNSRISDSEIASNLKISSQAVGKIRRKLETSVIDSYSTNLNYSKLGIQTFAIAIARIKRNGLDKTEVEAERNLLKNANVINVYKVPKGSSTHFILYGFRDMNELDEFFHSTKTRREMHDLIEIQELLTFSHNSLIKNSPKQLFHKVVNDSGNKLSAVQF